MYALGEIVQAVPQRASEVIEIIQGFLEDYRYYGYEEGNCIAPYDQVHCAAISVLRMLAKAVPQHANEILSILEGFFLGAKFGGDIRDVSSWDVAWDRVLGAPIPAYGYEDACKAAIQGLEEIAKAMPQHSEKVLHSFTRGIMSRHPEIASTALSALVGLANAMPKYKSQVLYFLNNVLVNHQRILQHVVGIDERGSEIDSTQPLNPQHIRHAFVEIAMDAPIVAMHRLGQGALENKMGTVRASAIYILADLLQERPQCTEIILKLLIRSLKDSNPKEQSFIDYYRAFSYTLEQVAQGSLSTPSCSHSW